MIADIIKTLQENNYYGGGKHIEIAKGKHEMVTSFSGLKRKIKRLWQLRKK